MYLNKPTQIPAPKQGSAHVTYTRMSPPACLSSPQREFLQCVGVVSFPVALQKLWLGPFMLCHASSPTISFCGAASGGH